MEGSGAAALSRQAAVTQAPAGSLPVLVVDDSEAERHLTAYYLDKAWPFERDLSVVQAADGREALEQLRRQRFAMVLLDWSMPGLGGAEILAELRQWQVRVPVVVVSGVDRDQLPPDLERLGATFLSKERMNPDSLREAIVNSLRLLGFLVPAGKPATSST